MKIKNVIKAGLIICFLGCLVIGCTKPTNLLTGQVLSWYNLNVDTVKRYGSLEYDNGLKAAVIPCYDNHTLRMYVSDSLDLKSTSTVIMHVVSYLKAGHLNKYECYFEVTHGTFDTYLTLGKQDIQFYFTAKPSGDDPVAKLAVYLQHFTSSPQSDSAMLYAELWQFPL